MISLDGVIVILLLGYYLITKEECNNIFEESSAVVSKVIATFCIIYGHLTSYIANGISLGGYWVALFYLWSGYGVLYSNNNKEDYLHSFIKKRGSRVIIPFFTAHIVYYSVKTITGKTISFEELLHGLVGGLTVVDYSWYPVSAIIMYVAFFIIWKKVFHNEIAKIITLFVFVFILSVYQAQVVKLANYWYTANFSFPGGMLLYHYRNQIKKLKKSVMIGGCGVIYVIGMVIVSAGFKIFGECPVVLNVVSRNLYSISFAIAGVVSLSIFQKYVNNCFWRVLSNCSYEMYLMHGLVIYLLTLIKLDGYILMVSVFVCTVFVGYGTNRINAIVQEKFEAICTRINL